MRRLHVDGAVTNHYADFADLPTREQSFDLTPFRGADLAAADELEVPSQSEHLEDLFGEILPFEVHTPSGIPARRNASTASGMPG